MTTLVLLGGAGSMGRITARDLCETWLGPAGRELVIADLDLERASSLVGQLRKAVAGRVTSRNLRAVQVNVRERGGAVQTLRGATILVNSLQYQLNLDVMALALELNAHYLDLGGLFHMTRRQKEWDSRFRAQGRIAVLGVGAAPGITNLLAAKGAETLDEVREIHCRVASWDGTRYEPKPALAVAYSLQTILEEFSQRPAVFTRGDWTFTDPMSGDIPLRFPAPIGLRRPMHTLHSEVATLPETFASKGVREVTFKIAFDPEFTDRVRFLRDLGMASSDEVLLPSGQRVRPIELVNRVALSQPPVHVVGRLRQAEVVRVVLKGLMGRRKVTRILDLTTRGLPEWGLGLDVDTGCPPSIVAQMICSQQIVAPGVHAPESAIPWKPFFQELSRRKMRVSVTERGGWGLKV
jgi:lysine 6-dehydrogenase